MDLKLLDAEPTDAEREAIDAVVGVDVSNGHRVARRDRTRRHLLLPALRAAQRRVGWVTAGALGYTSRVVFGLLLAESFGLAMLGGALGCAGAWALLHAVDIYRLSRGLFVNFAVTPRIVAQALAAAALLGVVSCLWPAWTSIRRSVVAGLRTVD